MKLLRTPFLAVILSFLLFTLASAGDATDPLVGIWECTNKVFTYEVSFFDNGLLLQQEPTFSNVRKSSWLRLGENQFVIDGGIIFNTDFQSNDELIVTNPNVPATWECSRKQ